MRGNVRYHRSVRGSVCSIAAVTLIFVFSDRPKAAIVAFNNYAASTNAATTISGVTNVRLVVIFPEK